MVDELRRLDHVQRLCRGTYTLFRPPAFRYLSLCHCLISDILLFHEINWQWCAQRASRVLEPGSKRHAETDQRRER